MPHSKPFSEDLRWTLVNMRFVYRLPVQQISAMTGLPPQRISKVCKLYRETCTVMPPQRISTRAKVLDENDAQVRVLSAI